MGRECGRSAGKEALTKFSCRWSGRNVPRISTCFHTDPLSSSLPLVPSFSRPFAIFNRERTEPPFPRASLPLSSSLPLLSLSLFSLFFFFFFLISYPSLILPPRVVEDQTASRSTELAHSNQHSYYRRHYSLPSTNTSSDYLPSFLPRETKRLRTAAKSDNLIYRVRATFMDGTKFEFRIERIFEKGGGGRRKEGEVGWYNWRLGINDILESGMLDDLLRSC